MRRKLAGFKGAGYGAAMAAASFRVEIAFSLTGRGLVLGGSIVQGTVRKGMVIEAPPGGPVDGFVIASVEYIDGRGPDGEWTASIGLILRSATPVSQMKALDWVGRQLAVREV